MSWLTLLFVLVALAGCLLLINHYIVVPSIRAYENRLAKTQAEFSVRPACPKEHAIRAQQYAYLKALDMGRQVENRVTEAPFPAPVILSDTQDAEAIMENLLKSIDMESVRFAGVEQFILVVFPPDQLYDTLLFSIDNIADHAKVVGADSLEALRAALREAAVNIHDPEAWSKVLSNVTGDFVDFVANPENWERVIETIEIGRLHPLQGFINSDTIIHATDPIFNTRQHLDEIHDSLIDNADGAFNDIQDYYWSIHELDPTGHFPIITLYRSASKQLKLLREQKTDIETAICNTVIHVGSRAVGAFAGASIFGFLVDLFLPGVGTLGSMLLGATGAVVGSAAGGAVGNEAMVIGVRAAESDYRTEYSRMSVDVHSQARQATQNVARVSKQRKQQYLTAIGDAPKLDPTFGLLSTITQTLYDHQSKEIGRRRAAWNILSSHWLAKRPRFRPMLAEMWQRLSVVSAGLPSQQEMEKRPAEALLKLVDSPYFAGSEHPRVLAEAAKALRERISAFRLAFLLWAIEASVGYNSAMVAIAEELKQQTKRYNESIAYWNTKLKAKANAYQRERDKLGL